MLSHCSVRAHPFKELAIAGHSVLLVWQPESIKPRSHPPTPRNKMGVLLTGTIIFLGLGFLSYFLVSVIYRNDKDSQAYVITIKSSLRNLRLMLRPLFD